MKTAPWFKLWAADYMMDRDIDELALEAQGLLLRVWCVIWIEGGIPENMEEIARKCRVSVLHVQKHMQNIMQFLYKDASGLLMSERMERERIKSKITSKARSDCAKYRWTNTLNAIASANAHAKDDAKTMHSESESDKRKKHKAQAPFILPSWVPKEPWEGWIEMRSKKGCKATDRAKGLAVKELEKLREQGQEPGAVLDNCTLRSWQGIFPIPEMKINNGSTPQPTVITQDSPLLKTRDGRPFKVEE